MRSMITSPRSGGICRSMTWTSLLRRWGCDAVNAVERILYTPRYAMSVGPMVSFLTNIHQRFGITLGPTDQRLPDLSKDEFYRLCTFTFTSYDDPSNDRSQSRSAMQTYGTIFGIENTKI